MRILTGVLLVVLSICSFGQLNWESKRPIPNFGREGSVGFAINGKVYVGLGLSATGAALSDFWEYDPATDQWTKKANYPGGGRISPTGFAINGKGYVGIGSNGSSHTSDFYEYNPTTDSWTQKASFIGGARAATAEFVIGDTAYMGLGSCGGPSCYKSDWYRYVPSTNTWTQIASWPGVNTTGASAFAIGQYGYAGFGFNSTYALSNKVYRYSVASNSWTIVADFSGSARSIGGTFTLDGKGYFACGTTAILSTNPLKDIYSYNPSSNSWTQETVNSEFGVATNIIFIKTNDSTVFGATGATSTQKLADLWELKVQDTCDYYDTTFVQDTSYITIQDTTYISVYDTTFITKYDTNYVTKYDTIRTQIYDTSTIFINDTLYLTKYDTTHITTYDTVTQIVYDSIKIYSYDTIIKYVNIAVHDTLKFSIYASNCGDVFHKIYPNPTSDWVYLYSNSPSCFSDYKVDLVDGLGQILETKDYESLVAFNMRGYARSIYFIRLVNKNNGDIAFSKKIVLE